MRVQVCIPHYFREHADPEANPHGYGSLRRGARLSRSIALGRCISSLLNLRRGQETCLLNISNRTIEHHRNTESPLEIAICIFTDGENMLSEVIDLYKNEIQIVRKSINNPRDLPLDCRDYLIKNHSDYDLLCYIEDDIIIHDKLYFDKIIWFHDQTNHQLSLMPHRYECIDKGNIDKLIIDGPNFTGDRAIAIPQQKVAYGEFRGVEPVSFDMASNPHSGTFAVSQQQALKLRERFQPRVGFIGPMETAATLTVLLSFPVLKPSQECWQFLRVEHGSPSFLHTISSLAHQV
jgi:hypothetical protein